MATPLHPTCKIVGKGNRLRMIVLRQYQYAHRDLRFELAILLSTALLDHSLFTASAEKLSRAVHLFYISLLCQYKARKARKQIREGRSEPVCKRMQAPSADRLYGETRHDKFKKPLRQHPFVFKTILRDMFAFSVHLLEKSIRQYA
jgi:hypothetical protein